MSTFVNQRNINGQIIIIIILPRSCSLIFERTPFQGDISVTSTDA